jgi:hypothetical protein
MSARRSKPVRQVPRPGVAARPGALEWTDLKRDDRVHHFEYGNGTVHSPGPGYMYITWDRRSSPFGVHTTAMARFLTPLGPDDEPVA